MNSKLKLCREAKSGGLFLTISSGNPIHQWYKGNYTDEKTGATYVIGYWIHVYKVYIYIDIGGVLDNIEYWSRIGLNFEQCFWWNTKHRKIRRRTSPVFISADAGQWTSRMHFGSTIFAARREILVVGWLSIGVSCWQAITTAVKSNLDAVTSNSTESIMTQDKSQG